MPDIPILGQSGTPDGPPSPPPPDLPNPQDPRININVMVRGVQPPPGAENLGRALVAITLGIGLVEATFVMPVATAEELGPIITKSLNDVTTQVRRVLSGVILPSDLPPDQAAKLFNGGHPHDPRRPR